MRKWIIFVGLAVLLLMPLVTIAQGDVDNVIELVFNNAGAQVDIKDSVSSVAMVRVELEGKEYILQVPITVDIDASVPLSSSLFAVDSMSRIGALAIQITDVIESTDEIEIILPGSYRSQAEGFESSIEGNKIVAIKFNTTNVGDERRGLSSFNTQGVDATGRFFEEIAMECENMNPGETGRCIIIFDVDEAIDIVALDIEVMDHRQITVPPIKKSSEDTQDTK